MLAVAGLLASLGGVGGWPPLTLSARFFAGLAALSAVDALEINVAEPMATVASDAVAAADRDVHASEFHADLARYRRDRQQFDLKMARLRLTSRLVTAALAFAVLGATVEVTSIG